MKTLLTVGMIAGLLSTAHAATIVNVDLNGIGSDDTTSAGTVVVQGAAGGGTFFNGTTASSMTGDYALNISSGALKDSFGATTGVTFTINNVAGDTYVGGAQYFVPNALYNDYVYNNDGTNNTVGSTGSAFTISGLGSATTADLYFYDPSYLPNPNIVLNVATGTSSGVFSTYNGLPATYYQNVTVTNGSISGFFGAGTTSANALSGFSISYAAVPEPSTYALMGCGLISLLAIRRFRNLSKV